MNQMPATIEPLKRCGVPKDISRTCQALLDFVTCALGPCRSNEYRDLILDVICCFMVGPSPLFKILQDETTVGDISDGVLATVRYRIGCSRKRWADHDTLLLMPGGRAYRVSRKPPSGLPSIEIRQNQKVRSRNATDTPLEKIASALTIPCGTPRQTRKKGAFGLPLGNFRAMSTR